MTELKGTFACPICGQDTPHHHTQDEIDAAQPTVAGVIAYCRSSAKYYRTTYALGHTMSVGAVASIFDRLADRLSHIHEEIQPRK